MVQVNASHSSSHTSHGGGLHSASSSTYHVHKGDTLSGIAARHGVSLRALERANPAVAHHHFIFAGDKLTIPGHGHLGAHPAATAHPHSVTSARLPVPVAGPAVGVRPAAGVVPSSTAPPPGRRLGDLSMVYETGHRPSQYRQAAATVSTGRGDPGGVSYGAYQLASRTGSVREFLAHEGSRWAAEFRGMDPTQRGGAFGQRWREIAAREPDAFFKAQHDFIQHHKYDVVVATVRQRTGVDINSLPPAVRDAVWSMSVQHGRAAQLVTDSVRAIQRSGKLGDGAAVINRLYDDRAAYVRRIDLPAGTRASLLDRYINERAQALSILGQ